MPARMILPLIFGMLVLPVFPQLSTPEEREEESAAIRRIGTASGEIKEAAIVDFVTKYPTSSMVDDAVKIYVGLMQKYQNAEQPRKLFVAGEILPVEPGEAEWNLDVIEGLFDFYFVQPAKLGAKKAALNAKLKKAGKSPMK